MRFFIFCLATVAHAETGESTSLPKSDLIEVEGAIKRIVLVNSQSDLLSEEELQSMEDLAAKQEKVPDFANALREELEFLFRGKSWNEETVEKIKAKIYEYYQNQDELSVIVIIPEQNRQSGVLQVVVEKKQVAREKSVAEPVAEGPAEIAIEEAKATDAAKATDVAAVEEPVANDAIAEMEDTDAAEVETAKATDVAAVEEPVADDAIAEMEDTDAVEAAEATDVAAMEEPVADDAIAEMEDTDAVEAAEATDVAAMEGPVTDDEIAEMEDADAAEAEDAEATDVAAMEEPVADDEIAEMEDADAAEAEDAEATDVAAVEEPVADDEIAEMEDADGTETDRGEEMVAAPQPEPESPEEEGAIIADAVLPAEIKGIVLISNKKELLSDEKLEQVEGLDVEGVDLPGYCSLLEQQLQPLYVDQPWNDETVERIENKIYEYYQSKERPFIIVTVPSQSKSSRVLQLIVEESKLGKVEVVGNKWTPTSRYLKYFQTQPGEPIYLRKVSKDINFINRNPFRRVNLIYSPGNEANRTDLTLQVSDRRPYRFYTGFENNGVPTTGRQRVFAGFSWDQIFNLDHSFFYQYTTNYNAQRFHANTFQYMALLPSETILNLYGGYSIVKANIPSPSQKNKGTNIQGSARYTVPFLPMRQFMQELTVGFDVKNTNNNMEFVDLSPTFGQTVNLTQFMFGYQCKWDKDSFVAECGADIFFSPMEWIPNQTNADFASLRPGATNRWAYATVFGKVLYPLGRSFTYSFFGRGQVTPSVLLPSEQIGFGGYDSVRGYDDRQYNADTGILVNNEIQSPAFSIFRSKQPNPDKMYFLVFLDAAIGVDNQTIYSVKPWNGLIGVGPGVRYSFGSYLTARFDWGFKLHRQADFTSGNSMVHFSVIGSY